MKKVEVGPVIGALRREHEDARHLPLSRDYAEKMLDAVLIELGLEYRDGHIVDPAVFGGKFQIGDRVRKTKGSSWQGIIVGTYNTVLTTHGYAVESEREKGSVQIYPEAALELVT